MAIYSNVPPPPETPGVALPSSTQATSIAATPATTAGAVDIDSWTVSALQSLSVSPVARGTGSSLAIPIDDQSHSTTKPPRASIIVPTFDGDEEHATATSAPPRRPPSRRDSMRRREALLKGHEGSRQRRRYDMARLTDVPNVEPPQPGDYLPKPTHPVVVVPYHVAAYWDLGLREQVEARTGKKRKMRHGATGVSVGRVPRDLKETVKKAPGVKGYVKDLEEPVRKFLVQRGSKDGEMVVVGEETDEFLSSEDEEIVFVGRHGTMRDGRGNKDKMPDGWKKAHREFRDQPVDKGMVYDALDDGESGRFKRWLTHAISAYYGLVSKSIMAGNPSRPCVYVGVRDAEVKSHLAELPRPLCELL